MHLKWNLVPRLLGDGVGSFMKPPSALCYTDTLPVAISWRWAAGEDACPPRVCPPEPTTVTVSPATWLHVRKTRQRKHIHRFLCLFLENGNGWVRRPEKWRGSRTDAALPQIKEDNRSNADHFMLALPVVHASDSFVLISSRREIQSPGHTSAQ